MTKTLLNRVMETLVMFDYMLQLHGAYNWFVYGTFFYLLTTRFFFVTIFYFAWVYYFDRHTPSHDGRRLPWVRRLPYWRYVASYFPITLHKTVDLDPSKNYMFCFAPHGIFAMSCFINFATEGTGFSSKFPGITIHPLTLEFVMTIPRFREVILALGCGSVTKEGIQYKLTKLGPGHSVVIVPGGVADIDLADPENPHRAKIIGRQGFVREALKAGATLVPVFSFGETEVLRSVNPSPGSLIDRFQKWCRRSFGCAQLITRGERFFILPYRKPINTVVGSPLEIPHILNPTDEEINYWHEKYVEALKKVFYENKERFACPGKDLELF